MVFSRCLIAAYICIKLYKPVLRHTGAIQLDASNQFPLFVHKIKHLNGKFLALV